MIKVNTKFKLILSILSAITVAFVVIARWVHLGKKQRILSVFRRQAQELHINSADLSVFLHLLSTFDKIATKKSIPYFLYSGTLLGYYRNKSLLPWDDDFDVSMNAKYVKTVQKAVKEIRHKGYRTHQHTENIFKIYSKSMYSVKGRRVWNYPYLDIVLQYDRNNETFLLEKKVHKTKDVYPTKLVKFLGLSVPVPQNVSRMLSIAYGPSVLTMCQSNYYMHKFEQYWPGDPVEVECQQLAELFRDYERQEDEYGDEDEEEEEEDGDDEK